MHFLHSSIEPLGDCARAALRYFLPIETNTGLTLADADK